MVTLSSCHSGDGMLTITLPRLPNHAYLLMRLLAFEVSQLILAIAYTQAIHLNINREGMLNNYVMHSLYRIKVAAISVRGGVEHRKALQSINRIQLSCIRVNHLTI